MAHNSVFKEQATEMARGGTLAPSWQHIAHPRWDKRAEREFGLEKGLAIQLMTQEEWDVHWQVLAPLSGPRRDHYRDQVHHEMMLRLKKRQVLLQ